MNLLGEGAFNPLLGLLPALRVDHLMDFVILNFGSNSGRAFSRGTLYCPGRGCTSKDFALASANFSKEFHVSFSV